MNDKTIPGEPATAATGAAADKASPWHYPIFRAIWSANVVSNFGTIIQSVGASWMMLTLSKSEIYVALVQSSATLPMMMLSMVSGAIADNFDRRKVMLTAQLVMFTISAALAAFALLGSLTPWLLLAFTFAIGCGMALNGPAWQASVGDMVERPAIPGAIALNSMGFNMGRSIAPAIGGFIVAASGAGVAFLINALSYLGLIGVLLSWRREVPPRLLPPETLGSAIGAGLRYVFMSPALRTILLRGLLFGFAAAAFSAMMPLVARDIMHGGPRTFGLLLGAFGVGSVVGAMRSGWLRRRFATEWIVRGAQAAMILGTVATALSPWLPLTMAALFVGGAGWVLALSAFNGSMQLGSPRWVVARSVALYQMFTFGGMAMGSWTFGALAEHDGVRTALLVAAALHLVGIGVGFARPLVEFGKENLDPIGRWTEPATAVPVHERSGPIVIDIEYRIAEANVIAFLSAMHERRRIRMRDGARHWRLVRDLGDATLWIERYQVATWLDYVRHNQRRTHADTANSERISQLHEGHWPPNVRRVLERQVGAIPAHSEQPGEEAASQVAGM